MDSFCFKLSWYNILKKFPDKVRHNVLDSIMEYVQSGTIPTLDESSSIAFYFIKSDIDEQIQENQKKAFEEEMKNKNLSQIKRNAANKRWHSENMHIDADDADYAACISASNKIKTDSNCIQNNSVNESINADDAACISCIKCEKTASSKENGEKEKEEKESCTKEKQKEENPLKENPPLKRESSEREKHPSQPSSELQETEPDKGIRTPSPNPSPFDFRRQLLKECLEDTHTENVKQVIDDWMLVRKRKNAVNSQTAFVRIMSQIKKAKVVYGLSCEQCIRIAAERSWTGFESEWLNESRTYGFAKKQTETKIESVNDLWK